MRPLRCVPGETYSSEKASTAPELVVLGGQPGAAAVDHVHAAVVHVVTRAHRDAHRKIEVPGVAEVAHRQRGSESVPAGVAVQVAVGAQPSIPGES
jgi:hypothetical protein